MAISRKNNECVGITAHHCLLINIVEHNKIRKILFIVFARIFRIEYHRRHIPDFIELRPKPGIGKITEDGNFSHIKILFKLRFPSLDIRLYPVVPLKGDIPVFEIHKSDTAGQFFLFSKHFLTPFLPKIHAESIDSASALFNNLSHLTL